MTKDPFPEYATPQDAAIARYGYVEDGCYGKWAFMHQGNTYVAYAFSEWKALEKIAASLGMCADDMNEAEWEVLERPVSAWESDPAKQ